MPALYKIVVNGQAHGQDIQNYFGYRVGLGIDPSIWPLNGADVVASNFAGEVLPAMLAMLSVAYTCQTLDVYTYNEQFELTLTQPFRMNINLLGTYEGQSLGPASNVTIKANFEPMFITEGLIAPKRGWISLGPLSEDLFEDGQLTDSFFNSPTTQIHVLEQQMCQNLENLLPPAIFYPVRLKQNKVLGVNTVVGYADIQSWSADRRLKIRKSRQYAR